MENSFQYIDEQFPRFVEELKEVCRQPSCRESGLATEPEDMMKVANLVARRMSAAGIDSRLMPVEGGNPYVYGEVKGRSPKTLLFFNHYDTATPGPLEQWTSGPFDPQVRGDKLYARGTADNKGNLMARVQAVETLLRTRGNLPVTIKFIVEGKVNVYSPHFEPFVRANEDVLRADACIWEAAYKMPNGRPAMRLAEKGRCYVELNVRAMSSDASVRYASVFPHAAWQLVWALSTLKNSNEEILIKGFYDHVDALTPVELKALADIPVDDDHLKRLAGIETLTFNAAGVELAKRLYALPTCTIVGVNAGKGGSSNIPATATARLDLSIVPSQDPDDIHQKLQQHFVDHGFRNVDVQVLGKLSPSQRTPPDDPFVELVNEAGKQVYGQAMVKELSSPGFGPSYAVRRWGIPVVGLGISYAGSRIDGADEHVRLEDYRQGLKHIVAIIEGFAAAS